jgi:tetratricopeptide (TPR) repeat protein
MQLTPQAAYRRDIECRSLPFSPNDGLWVAAAGLLEQAVLVPGRERGLIHEAVDLAKQGLGVQYRQMIEREFGHARLDGRECLLLLSDEAYQRGALNTAYAILDALWAAANFADEVARGRILVRMARIANKLGFLDAANDQLVSARRLGKAIGSAELEVRALIGLGSVAQSRGNYPVMLRHAKRAADLADRNGLRFLARFAHSGLMIATAQRGDFASAMRQAAIVYAEAVGHPYEEAELLQNVGQMLLGVGYADEAASMFTAVLTRPLPEHFVLAALGGLALASAKRGDHPLVLWASGEVERLERAGAQRYHAAIALLECAIAMLADGLTQRGEQARIAALRLGEQHGYHEVTIRAERAAREALASSNVCAMDEAALQVARSIRAREAERLPDHVMVAAPASV